MRIAINAISATAGGARTYLLNLARALPALGAHEYQLYIPKAAAPDLAALPANFHIALNRWAERNYAARLVWEQTVLPREAKRWGADVLICVGGFCPLRSRVPVLLLSRNPLYFTPRFLRDLLERRHYAWALRHVAMTRLSLWSARAARLTIVPTSAMGEMIRATAGGHPLALRTIPHGFELWPSAAQARASAVPPPPPFRFLVVSHYNYFRNFETVLRAFAQLRGAYGNNGRLSLTLTADLRPGLRPGGYHTTRAGRLLQSLHLGKAVTTLGAVPYEELPRVYRSAHAVICPAYTESFSHTVIEAMAMGVPVIASDIGVHREVAGEAALFFPPLDPAALAERCRMLMDDASLRERLRALGEQRAQSFSWRRHFEEVLAAAAEVAGRA
ncbi:MAG TPA: glycosyltransferase family 1 protein [Bryobacterales bacterium]|nr:glycosyltransferase family 1 protein [Bryobacterales bacterium]